MKAIILAAGQSNRVKPIKDKNFLSFCGKYLIEWQLDTLIDAGIREFVIVGNKDNLEILKEFSDIVEFVNAGVGQAYTVGEPGEDEVYIRVIEQEIETHGKGMAGAVLACEKACSGQPVLIVSSNDVVDAEAYKDILAQKDAGAGALLGYEVPEYFPGGYLNLGDSNKIEGIVEKPGEGNEPSNYVNIVVHLHNNYDVLLEALKTAETEKDDHYEVALDSLFKEKEFTMVPYTGFWQPLKFPWHVHELNRYFLKKRRQALEGNDNYEVRGDALIHKTVEIAESATIKGEVIIEEDVKIFENAVIKGPAYLEEGCVVANQALFRDSFAGQKCVVGFATEIARSHLGDDVWTHSNYIGDSIIGSNVSFGAGAITANLRLDEGDIKWQGKSTGQNKLGIVTGDHIRVGVQTCLMPGIAIGSNSMIGGGITVSEDIAENEFVYGKTELIRKENKIDVSNLLR